jgi:hypothetical protein
MKDRIGNRVALSLTSISLLMLGLVILGPTPKTIQAAPTPPFTQCPPIGFSASCGVLIEFTDSGTNIFVDPAVPPFDGSDDTLVGVQNDSSATVNNVTLSGVGATGAPIFGFEADGLCVPVGSGPPPPPGCPFGPTTYEGPNTSFSGISPDETTGTVNFTGGLAPGGSGYFSLEDRLVASSFTTISLTPPTATNPAGISHTVTATIQRGDGTPVVGRTVTFTVTSGPDTGVTGTAVTDASGHAMFTYVNNGTVGTDTIMASFVNDQGATQSATATKTWIAPPTPQEAYVTASKSSVKKGQQAAFIVALDPGPAVQPVTVHYSMSGGAILGTDYTLSGTPGQVTIPAGQSFAKVILHAQRNVKKNATMTLTPGPGYFLSGLADDVATIRIKKK